MVSASAQHSVIILLSSESLGLGLLPSSGIFINQKTQRFGNWNFFLLQVRKIETSALLGPLERANFNHW
jgi:hypothetical protein